MAPALDENGMPNDPIAICEDSIGANVDGSEGGNLYLPTSVVVLRGFKYLAYQAT